MIIKRSTIGSANSENFTVVLRSVEDKELLRKKFKSNIPETPIGDRMRWNLELIYPPALIEVPFRVYVIDALEDEPFEFLVEGVK